MSINFEIDTSDYEITMRNLDNGLQDFLPQLVAESAIIMRDEMKEAVPVKTGKLKASIRADILPESAEISTNSGYGLYVDEDTDPHVISARGKANGGANFLRFVIDGNTFFRRSVFHTGTKGQHFRQKTIKRSMPRIDEVFENKLRELLA
jgi:hypothetical protein